jgi:hypothetical protein
MTSISVDRLAGVSTAVAVKAPVKAVATSAITLSGEQTINSVACVAGDRVLVTAQASSVDNGIYDVATSAWTRSLDFDGSRDVVKGTLIVSNTGTTIYYRVTSTDPVVIGTSAITFEVVSGAVTQSTIGAALYPRTAAEISAGVTPTTYQYEPGDIRRYGAVGDGTTDNSTAFANALLANDSVFVPDAPTAWSVGSTISVSAGKAIYGVGIASEIRKGANGALISLGKNTTLSRLYLNGNGGTYSGVGVSIGYTAEFEGYQLIESCRVYNSESYAVSYAAAMAGFGSKIVNCDLNVASNTVECVLWPTDGTNKHGNRSVINCTAGSGSLIDCGSSENGFIIGNTSGDGNSLAAIKYGADSQKMIVVGNRLAATATITIKGDAHTFVGNVCGCALVVDVGVTDCHIGNNVIVGTVTDNSGESSNQLDTKLTAYTPVWTGESSNPALGDGTTYGFWIREGKSVTYTLGVNMGASTTYGTGTWRFSVPVPCTGSTNCYGTFLAKAATGSYYTGVVQLSGSGTYLTIFAPEIVTSAVPFTWASGDWLRIQISYIS